LREISYRIATRLEQQEDLLTIGDPSIAEAHAHPPTQRLDIQQPLWERPRHEEPTDRSCREWTFLPGQSHRVRSSGCENGRLPVVCVPLESSDKASRQVSTLRL